MAKPKNPTNVKAVYDRANNRVVLTWVLPVSSPATTSVKIQRWVDNTQLYTDLATVGAVSTYADASPTAGRTYAYRLLAVNSEGTQAVYSLPSNKVLIINPPQPATNVTAQRNSNDSVGLNWKNTTSVGAPVDYNYIFRWDNVTKTQKQIDRITGALVYYLDSTAPLDRGLKYRNWSSNAAGGAYYMSAFSGMVYTTPAAPTSVAARWSGRDIIVTWKNPSTIASKFEIEHTTDNTNWFPVATLGKAVTWRHITPERGVLHRYRIRPTSPTPTLGTAAVGAWVYTSTIPASDVPNPPTILGPAVAAANSTYDLEIRYNPVDDSPMGGAQYRYRLQGATSWAATRAGLTMVSYPHGSNVEVQVATKTATSAFSEWSDSVIIKVKNAPAVTMTSPASHLQLISGPLIPVTWTASTQTAWEVRLLDQTDGLVQLLSGTTERKALLDQVTNSTNPYVQLRIFDGELWSGWQQRQVQVNFLDLTGPALTVTKDPDNLNVTIQVSAVPGSVRREVLRRVVGPANSFVSIGDTDSNGFLLDARPPLGVDVEYIAIVWGAAGQSGTSVVEIVNLDRHVVVVNYGPGLGDSAYMEVDLSAISAKIQRERALHQFAGRSLPVVVLGAAQSHSVGVSGRVVDELGSPAKVWHQMVTTPGDKWFRDPEGRSFLCSIESVQVGEQDGWMDVSFTADEVQAL